MISISQILGLVISSVILLILYLHMSKEVNIGNGDKQVPKHEIIIGMISIIIIFFTLGSIIVTN